MSIAVNPQNSSLLNAVPYLSVSQFRAAATSIDVSSLVPSAGTAAQDGALAELIAEASSWIDQWCFPLGTGGTLAASMDTDTAWTRTMNSGYMPLICRFKPVLELVSASFGVTPSNASPLSTSMYGDVFFDGKVIMIPGWGTSGANSDGLIVPRRSGGGKVFAQWTYVDGYPHVCLKADADTGDDTLQVSTATGVYPPTPLMIYDGPSFGANNEHVQVIGISTVGDITTLTLASPLLYPHTVPAAPDAILISALPPAVVRAAVYVTASLIKQRGGSAMVLKDLSSPEIEAQKGGSQGGGTDMDWAMKLLRQFRIVKGSA